MSKKIKGVAFLLVLLCSSISSTGQIVFKEEAKRNILELKDGVLLVRLEDRAILCKNLEKQGRTKELAAVKAQYAEQNKKYVNAFAENFNFCPVYFFYASETDKVKAGQLADVHFLNQSLDVDSSIVVSSEKVYTAEFTKLQVEHEIENQKNPNKNGTYRPSDLGFHALVIKNSQFEQLQHPFPFYTKTLKSLPFKRTELTVVEMMNEKLHDYLKSLSAK